jgi:glycerate kinase
MRVLFAPDKFKGSLGAAEAAAIMARGWSEGWPESEIALHPLADGGDGSLDVLQASLGGEWMKTAARNARGRSQRVRWLWQRDRMTAWIETARVSGLAELSAEERDPLTAASTGVGEVIASAVRDGAETIMICLGGIATNDAGCGMAAALGFRFLDGRGMDINPIPASLLRVERIQAPPINKLVEIIALTDVRNPLLGPEGASSVYGPQKGAAPCDVEILENALSHIVDIARRDIMAPDPMLAGTGAAGGLGYGVMAFLGGQLLEGSERIGELTGLTAAVRASDLIVTGEGRLDAQTAAGKAPAHVARLAREQGKPVIAIVGSMADEAGNGIFDAVFPLVCEPYGLATAMRDAPHLLEKTAAEAARSVKRGKVR